MAVVIGKNELLVIVAISAQVAAEFFFGGRALQQNSQCVSNLLTFCRGRGSSCGKEFSYFRVI